MLSPKTMYIIPATLFARTDTFLFLFKNSDVKDAREAKNRHQIMLVVKNVRPKTKNGTGP